MKDPKNQDRNILGEWLIAAFLVLVIIIDFIVWKIQWISTGTALVVLFIDLAMILGLEYLVQRFSIYLNHYDDDDGEEVRSSNEKS